MIAEQIKVANVKCPGCAQSIETQLGALEGVNEVKVEITEGTVSVAYDQADNRDEIKQKLEAIGYPEIK